MCVSRFSDLAVDVIVAHPAGRDARGVPALELAGAAGGRCALHLVGAVAAVVLAVAHEVPGDAPAAGAGELVGSAGDITWIRKKKKIYLEHCFFTWAREAFLDGGVVVS